MEERELSKRERILRVEERGLSERERILRVEERERDAGRRCFLWAACDWLVNGIGPTGRLMRMAEIAENGLDVLSASALQQEQKCSPEQQVNIFPATDPKPGPT